MVKKNFMSVKNVLNNLFVMFFNKSVDVSKITCKF